MLSENLSFLRASRGALRNANVTASLLSYVLAQIVSHIFFRHQQANLELIFQLP